MINLHQTKSSSPFARVYFWETPYPRIFTKIKPLQKFPQLSVILQVTSETEVTETLDKITSVSDADYGDDGS